MSTATVKGFLDTLETSNLLKPEQLAVARELGVRLEAPQIGQELIRRGWLTDWQTRQIFAGRTKLFLGTYKLLDVLGQGGMGAVLKAESRKLGRVVALKVMSNSLANDAVAQARFQREIQYAARLDHPNIVRAIDADQVGDRCFLVMEYFEGMDLKALLKLYGRLSIEFSCECIRQAAMGLQHAADRGIVHRDVKPSNMLVTRMPESGKPLVKVMDLGLARFMEGAELPADTTITKSGQIMGSPDYMAPEQVMDSRLADSRSDIYSLGVTLFQLISGELPFEGENVMGKLVARMNTDAPPISSRMPSVPPVLVHIIARMMHRDPAQRFQTPADVAALLDAFVSNPDLMEFHSPVAQPTPSVAATPTIGFDAPVDDTLNLFVGQLHSHGSSSTTSEPVFRRTKNPWPTTIALNVAVLLVAGGAYLAMQHFEDGRAKSAAVRSSTAKPSVDKSKLAGSSGAATRAAGTARELDDAQNASGRMGSDGAAPPRRGGGLFDTFGGSEGLQSLEQQLLDWARPIAKSIRVLTDEGEIDVPKGEPVPSAWQAIVALELDGLPTLTDDDMRLLNSAGKLRDLSFAGGRINDSDARSLSGIKTLSRLNLGNTLVSDDGLAPLARLKKLRELNLRYTDIGDTGLGELAEVTSLRVLVLEGTNVTDASADVLQKLTGLIDLDLRHTRLSASTIARLRAALPDCKVVF